MARGQTEGALPDLSLGKTGKTGKRFVLRAPIVREPVLHKQIADAFRLEIAPPGKLSREGVAWYSVDMAAYAGNAPGIRVGRGCIAGVSDIEILYNCEAYFIEVKADDGVLSPAQRDFAHTVLGTGCRYAVARNASEAVACLDRWDIPRAHRLHGG